MDITVYNQKGEEVGKAKVSKEIFAVPMNEDLLHQVAVSMNANKRVVIAHAKTRAEVRGGGAKPWRQKGTGRARHGSSRSPIWVGGGVTHGPLKEKNYKKKINKKMMKKAFYVALSEKLKNNQILVLDELKLKEPKTKEADMIVKNLGKIEGFGKLAGKSRNRGVFLTKGKDANVSRAFNNLPGIEVGESRNLNVLDILNNKYLIFSKESLKEVK